MQEKQKRRENQHPSSGNKSLYNQTPYDVSLQNSK